MSFSNHPDAFAGWPGHTPGSVPGQNQAPTGLRAPVVKKKDSQKERSAPILQIPKYKPKASNEAPALSPIEKIIDLGRTVDTELARFDPWRLGGDWVQDMYVQLCNIKKPLKELEEQVRGFFDAECRNLVGEEPHGSRTPWRTLIDLAEKCADPAGKLSAKKLDRVGGGDVDVVQDPSLIEHYLKQLRPLRADVNSERVALAQFIHNLTSAHDTKVVKEANKKEKATAKQAAVEEPVDDAPVKLKGTEDSLYNTNGGKNNTIKASGPGNESTEDCEKAEDSKSDGSKDVGGEELVQEDDGGLSDATMNTSKSSDDDDEDAFEDNEEHVDNSGHMVESRGVRYYRDGHEHNWDVMPTHPTTGIATKICLDCGASFYFYPLD